VALVVPPAPPWPRGASSIVPDIPSISHILSSSSTDGVRPSSSDRDGRDVASWAASRDRVDFGVVSAGAGVRECVANVLLVDLDVLAMIPGVPGAGDVVWGASDAVGRLVMWHLSQPLPWSL
jgi:hypothetical protein